MSNQKPCCAAAAARKVKKLNIGGNLIGISNLDSIIEEVSRLELDDEKDIKKELLKRVKIYNYISPASEKDYEDALFGEYKRQRRVVD